VAGARPELTLPSTATRAITIDPAAANAQAIRAYEKAAFEPVGVMRQYERDMATGEWRDGLLMELIGAPSEDGAP
jgi:RimJ/RimL family protein N-acetyltransferase